MVRVTCTGYVRGYDECALRSHRQDFDLADATHFAQLLEVLHPGATGKAIVALLDGKANRTTALAWRSGRRGTPQWVIDLLADKVRRRQEIETQIVERAKQAPPRPGRKAGAINLARYRQRSA